MENEFEIVPAYEQESSDDEIERCLMTKKPRGEENDYLEISPIHEHENSRRLGAMNDVQRRHNRIDRGHFETSTRNDASNGDCNYAQLLFIALIDIIAKMNEPSDVNRRKRFFEKMAKTLVKNGVTSPVCFSRQLHGVRQHVELAFLQMISNARKSVQYEDILLRNHIDSGVVGSRRAQNGIGSVSVVPKVPVFNWNGTKTKSIAVSRYESEFEEIEQLGKGGFGAVFKVRHYLDDQYYAVKKIGLSVFKLDTCVRALREVTNLAMLNHSNIVRYYASWLEFDTLNQSNQESRRIIPKPKIKELSSESITNAYLSPFKLRRCLSSPDVSSSGGNVEESGIETSVPAAFGNEFENDENGRSVMGGTLSLCLQMELCTSTLRAWINRRNISVFAEVNDEILDRFDSIDKSAIRIILRQILDALAYIHSRGIIHRDLKPGNIFLQSEHDPSSARILLGDFGLSCYEKPRMRFMIAGANRTERSNDAEPTDLAESGTYHHSSGMGTLAYSAPEQLKSQFYDCKADMYSFGIVALEMYFPFSTYMERIHNIMRLRQGELDEKFQRSWPLEAAIIRQLVEKRASSRPSARQMLDNEVVLIDDSLTVADLKMKLRNMEEELRRMKHGSVD